MKCELCGGELQLVHTGTRDNPNIDVYECVDCHTKQLDTRRDNDYEHGFMNGTERMSAEEIQKRLESCKADDVRRFEMMRELCAGKKVLDFGCGFAGFLDRIRDVASEAVGVELGSDEREYAKSANLDVRKDISDCGTYDVITLFHVFEHLNDPRKWLDIFAEHLEKGGQLIVEVPNSQDALLELYHSEAFADFTYWSAHLYLYTKDSLSRLIHENGNYRILDAGQVQRYPLANHLYWLACEKPGGQVKWPQLNDEALNREYERVLRAQNLCDTLFFRIERL